MNVNGLIVIAPHEYVHSPARADPIIVMAAHPGWSFLAAGAMQQNLLTYKNKVRSLFNAADNGDVGAQEELARLYRIFIWCKNDPKLPRH